MRTAPPLIDGCLVVPLDVMAYPFCHEKLTISPDGWSVRDDDTWTCDSFTFWCDTEPDVDDPDYDKWEMSHPHDFESVMQINHRITKWMDKNFDWDDF